MSVDDVETISSISLVVFVQLREQSAVKHLAISLLAAQGSKKISLCADKHTAA